MKTIIRRILLAAVVAVVASVTLVPDALAIRYQPRPDWMVGVAFGLGRGAFEGLDGGKSDYRNGAAPEIHVGRMLGEHFMAGVSYEGWLIEFGTLDPDLPDKIRRTLQNLTVAFAVFPGNQRGASGGIFLRAGVGLGWAGTGEKDAKPGESQDEGTRYDEWGVGMFGEGGYEFWISSHFTAGLSATYNYFDIGGDRFVDKAWFGAVVLNLNLYW